MGAVEVGEQRSDGDAQRERNPVARQVQPDLFLDRAPIRPVDTHLVRAEKPRLTGQNATVLARLMQGPASNFELMQIASRFGARLHDIKHAGYAWSIIEREHDSGRVVYALDEVQS